MKLFSPQFSESRHPRREGAVYRWRLPLIPVYMKNGKIILLCNFINSIIMICFFACMLTRQNYPFILRAASENHHDDNFVLSQQHQRIILTLFQDGKQNINGWITQKNQISRERFIKDHSSSG